MLRNPTRANRSFCSLLMLLCCCSPAVGGATEISFDQHRFSFHGYGRTSLATSEGGNTAAHFAAPGAGAKYRLGNESDTQLRLRFDYNNRGIKNRSTYLKSELAIEGYRQFGNTSEFELDSVPKANITLANINGSGLNYWLGRRWYGRKGSYINDYWWLNSGQKSHIGTGIEGLKFLSAKLNIAGFYHRDKHVSGIDNYSSHTGTLRSRTLDIRWEGLSLGHDHQLNLWALYADRPEESTLGYESKNGFGIGAWFNSQNMAGGKNTLALTYRQGAAMTQNTYSSKPIRENQGYDLDNSSMWEINNTWLFDNQINYAIQWIALARQENFGEKGSEGELIRWLSTGARPVFYLNEFWSVATELGLDYVDNEILGAEGSLAKLSLALQLSPNRGFMNRPVVRLFGTYAMWGDDLIGHIGGVPDNAPYAGQDSGWNIGLQVEHAW